MSKVYLVSACRTPIGKFQGAFSGFRAPELGAFAVAEALSRAGVAGDAIDEVILGNVLQAGVGQNPARQAARGAGIPDEVAPFTVNKVCGSGLQAVMFAAQAIRVGDASAIVAGGMENMTRAPHLLFNLRGGQKLGDSKAVDAIEFALPEEWFPVHPDEATCQAVTVAPARNFGPFQEKTLQGSPCLPCETAWGTCRQVANPWKF